jgi:hypothetical protein
MSLKENDIYIENRLENIADYLSNLDDDLFLQYFNEKLGCDPVNYYAKDYIYYSKDDYIDTILECFTNADLLDPGFNYRLN